LFEVFTQWFFLGTRWLGFSEILLLIVLKLPIEVLQEQGVLQDDYGPLGRESVVVLEI